MKCEYAEEITEEEIKNVELKLKFEFPEDFKEFIKKNNGGRPERKILKVNGSEEKVRSFLSFKEEDKVNIIKFNRLEDSEGIRDTVVAIAIDPFGNYIVFNREDNKMQVICEASLMLLEAIKFSKDFDMVFANNSDNQQGVTSNNTHNTRVRKQ